MATREKIRSIISEIAKREVSIGPEESLFDSGFLDSFALVDVVVRIEQEFKVKVPDSDLGPRKFNSISSIETYLERLSKP